MPKFIIHIGPHKTGTTYIQRRLEENAALLLEQGIYVPTHWRDSVQNPSHTKFVRYLLDGNYAQLTAEFEGFQRADYSHVVISSEAIMACGNDMLGRVRDMLAGSDCVIVYYVRRWSELLLSCWNELIVQGSTMDFLLFASECLANSEGSNIINFDRQIVRFVKLFGRSNVKLVSYDTVIERGGDIFRHFSRHFLVSPNILPLPKLRANASTAPEKTELCRILNHIDQEGGSPPSAKMMSALRCRRDIDLDPMLNYIRGFHRSIILHDDADSIRQILRRNRAAYADCFVPPVPPYASYEPKSVSVGFIGSEYMLAPGFPEAVRQLREELKT